MSVENVEMFCKYLDPHMSLQVLDFLVPANPALEPLRTAVLSRIPPAPSAAPSSPLLQAQHALSSRDYSAAHALLLSAPASPSQAWGVYLTSCLTAHPTSLPALTSPSLSAALQWLSWSVYLVRGGSSSSRVLVDAWNGEQATNALQIEAHSLWRYYAAAAVLSKRRSGAMRETAAVLRREKHRDAVVDFVIALYGDADFERASTLLDGVRECAKKDFFLSREEGELVETARFALFEMYCRVHCQVRLETIVEKLGVAQEEAEEWIASLVRNTHLDAKLNESENCLVVSDQAPSVHQLIENRTKGLTYRTSVLRFN